MKKSLPPLVVMLVASFTGVGLVLFADEDKAADKKTKPIKALLLTGGCCHDYPNQKAILSTGLGERVNVEFDVVQEGGTGTKYKYPLLQKKNWAKPYDVVIYNICFAHEEDTEYVDAITKTHAEGVPAMAIHCTYHTYHWKVKTDSWEKMLGVTSPRHGKHHPITVKNAKPKHPIMKDFPVEWVTPKGELYHVDKTWDTATALATGTIDGGKKTHDCVWANEFGKTRVFGTTLGHHNETMSDDIYLDLVSRGLLWVTGHLKEDGKAEAGYGKNRD